MARKKLRSYFEPWLCTKSAQHGKNPFPDGLPTEGYPEGVAATILDAWQRIDRDAPWIIWGSRMATPAICKNLDGTIAVTDSQRIITMTRKLGLADGPSHEELSKRIAACVNSMAGIADPEKFIADARALLLGYATGECTDDPRDDTKVISLLGRCIPPEELERFKHEEAED